MIPHMQLSYLSWEAFAALLTGALAVGAAIYVGLRQASIAARQTKIIAQQIDIAALSIRVDTFEKRMAAFDAVRRWLDYILRVGNIPGGVSDRSFPAGHEKEFWKHGASEEAAFLSVRESSRFLFSPPVHDEIERLYGEAMTLDFLLTSQAEGAMSPQEYGDAIVKQRHILKLGRQDLWRVFVPDMHLTSHRVPKALTKIEQMATGYE